MTTASIIGQNKNGSYKVNIKPDNPKQGMLGAGGMVINAPNKEEAQKLVNAYNKPVLERSPQNDTFVPNVKGGSWSNPANQ